MDTRSKNINVFRGLISLISMTCIYAIVAYILTAVIFIIIRPDVASAVGEALISIASGATELPPGTVITIICFITIFVLILAGNLLFRRDRLHLETLIARGLSRMWIEIKILISLLVLGACLLINFRHYVLFDYSSLIPLLISIPVVIAALYFACLDIGKNRRIFRHNILNSVLNLVMRYKKSSSVVQKGMKRVFACLAAILVTIIFVAVSFTVLYGMNSLPAALTSLLIGVFCVTGTIFWYAFSLKQSLKEWEQLMYQINEMYEGNLNAVNHIPPSSDFFDCAMQLNMIRSGIEKAVEEGIKADRTKVELITNVSHDLKTPLTSIIGYVELLKKEPGLPEHVMEYIDTISQKSNRLNTIVQDVFDISKATTGNIKLDLVPLDMSKLLKQVLAEMNEIIESSSLHWIVEIPDDQYTVYTDGERMYRVFQNLIRNCAQYSLESSRVYITLSRENGKVNILIRNVSKNEINVSAENLTSRFVRGDGTRSSEGSGLGLSIAKSFTEACNGEFDVQIDRDLFTVSVRFPEYRQEN